MPSIQQIVAQIRTAVYGRDVRENIALGIEQCYADSTAEGQIARIEQEGQNQISRVETKGQETIESIPSDYTTLANAVAALSNGAAVVPKFSVADVFPNDSTYNMNDFPINSIVDVPANKRESTNNRPAHFTSGFEVLTLNSRYPSYTGCFQIAVCYDKRMAHRIKTTAWTAWVYDYDYDYVENYTVKSSGGDFSDVAQALKTLSFRFGEWDEHHYAVIEVDEGVFSLGNVVNYISSGDIEQRGLYIPPFCKLKGKGKDKTFLRLYYEGNDSTFMYNVSGLNMPYESSLEDLTLQVKNVRYGIHSDGGMGWYKKDGTTVTTISEAENTLRINNVGQHLKNVKILHRGFDAGKTPIDPSTGQEYKTPAAWGSGSWNNTIQEFYDCDFISLGNCPWFNHNRETLTNISRFKFVNCTFLNGLETNPQMNLTYAGVGFISWGSGIRDVVEFHNCYTNHAVALYNRGNSATCDYYVYSDNDMTFIETNTNNAHTLNNYIMGNCYTEITSVGIRAYAPVSKEFRKNLVKYNSGTDYIFAGITLYAASENEPVICQRDGYVYIPTISTNSTLYVKGKKLGYNNSTNEWVEVENDPIIEVINYQMGKIVI